jgi:hypothetical protein
LIDLTQLPYLAGSMSATVCYNSGTNISTITFSDGISANNETLHFSGNYIATAWSFASVNGGAGTEVADPPTDSGAVTSGATGEIAAASAASGGTVGTPVDSFHFTDEISASKGSGVIDVAELNDIPTSMGHREDAAGSHGPLAISEGGETPSTLGDSFHFMSQISGSKASGSTDVAELNDIPASTSHHESAAGTRGLPVISEGAQPIEPPLLEQQADHHFNLIPPHAPGAPVTQVPHDLIV